MIDERGLRLADIAEISYEEPLISYGRHLNRQDAVALNVYKESTANTVEVVHAVNRVIEEDINTDPLLAGVNLFVWEDQAEQITSGIDGFDGGPDRRPARDPVPLLLPPPPRLDADRVAVDPVLAHRHLRGDVLPGQPQRAVDDGSDARRSACWSTTPSWCWSRSTAGMRDEPDRKQAALEGARQVLMAVTASTATTLIVFLPLIVGADTELTTWLGEVGITISLALACSLFSSLTLIPLMSAHVLRARAPRPHRPVEWLEDRYVRISPGPSPTHRTFGLLISRLVVGFLPLCHRHGRDRDVLGARQRAAVPRATSSPTSSTSRRPRRWSTGSRRYLERTAHEFLIESVYSYFGENAPAPPSS